MCYVFSLSNVKIFNLKISFLGWGWYVNVACWLYHRDTTPLLPWYQALRVGVPSSISFNIPSESSICIHYSNPSIVCKTCFCRAQVWSSYTLSITQPKTTPLHSQHPWSCSRWRQNTNWLFLLVQYFVVWAPYCVCHRTRANNFESISISIEILG